MSREAITILLAEDDDGHAVLVERNLRRAGVTNRIERARDGQEALDYLRSRGNHAGREPDGPLLMLLDINMPRVDGVEVLRQMKASPSTARIPVVMLTTTDNPHEVERCYDLGCSVYVTKPVTYDDLSEAMRRLSLFLSIVTVPPETAARGGGLPA
ncbi:MAG TPA: response regulator [Luteitalea sp.]|nr:response regulator [Luteitalea sp.]